MKDTSKRFPIDPKTLFPFTLDQFQQEAIAALDQGHSVVICAPTGSGKTLIGEYAIYRALSRGKRVFYTTPLKALSNQKFRDFQQRFGDSPFEVGLITGDILINPEAAVVIMTTEIFRNMLYQTPIGQVGTSLRDVDAVVLDECHYISDRGRGTVWEESIIYCPPTIQLVALSATIGNPEELTDWINQVRKTANLEEKLTCKLINSDFRPVPLRFHFSSLKGLFPLLNAKQTGLNPKLATKSGKKNEKGRFKREECPNPYIVIKQLREKEMLPVIYVIFSRRGCDRAVDDLETLNLVTEAEAQQLQLVILKSFLLNDPDLQTALLNLLVNYPQFHHKILQFLTNTPENDQELLQFLQANPPFQKELFDFIEANSELVRKGQLEPLLRGIAVHHAGLLPVWKELVEQLFEAGLVKVVFATATLSAGINMPARTTVISALSRRTDSGHQMLTSSEFLQIAGRAGRRGLDKIGHVVTLQTPFEGAKEAAYLATAKPDPLKSCFTPSYGMVLNLLQKHSLPEVQKLLQKSFAEYLAQKRLLPTQQAIAQMSTELAKLDVELAGIDPKLFEKYEKLTATLKEEERLLDILEHQANIEKKRIISPLLPNLLIGSILHLKGKHLRVRTPVTAILVTKIPGSGQAEDLVCLGEDNRWYIVTNNDVADLNDGFFPPSELEKAALPPLDPPVKLGKGQKGNQITAQILQQLPDYVLPLKEAPEVLEQQRKVKSVQTKLDNHPFQQLENPSQIIKRYKHRIDLSREIYKLQAIYRKHESARSYYWQDFLNLIEVLREFKALDGYKPTVLGEVSAVIRGENELWLGLTLLSGKLDHLEPHHFAAAMSALITETPRPDSWTDYAQTPEVLEAFGFKLEDQETNASTITLREVRRQLNQSQKHYGLLIPVWLECKFIGLVEQWALGTSWQEICESTSLDEGDLVRILRRTVDVLWQIPQIPAISDSLKEKAKTAIAMIKRFPVL